MPKIKPVADDKAARAWWLKDGVYIDPDTEDVDWFDKRAELSQIAFIAGVKHGRDNQENGKADDFTYGYLVAAAEVMRLFDQPGIAFELMRTAGVSTKAGLRKAKLPEFDHKPLAKVLYQQGAR